MKKKTPIVKAVLVSLDAILDTRLGVLSQFSNELATKVLASGYHTRDCDVFEGIDPEAFKKQYAARDVEVLKRSMATACLPMLRMIAIDMMNESVEKHYFDEVQIHINAHPYKLEPKLAQLIALAVQDWVGSNISVYIKDYQLEDITPELINEQYPLVIMYHYQEWLNLMIERLGKKPIPFVTLLGPALYFVRRPTETELREVMEETGHPFAMTEAVVKPLIDLTLIDPKYFSILTGEEIIKFDNFLHKLSENFKKQFSS